MEANDKKGWIVDLVRNGESTPAFIAGLLIALSVVSSALVILWRETVKEKDRLIVENAKLRVEKDSLFNRSAVSLKDCQDDLLRSVSAAKDEMRAQYEYLMQLSQQNKSNSVKNSKMIKQHDNKIKQLESDEN